MRTEYDFSHGVRGKYARRLRAEGSNVVVLDADVAKAFPNSAAVNAALRVVMGVGNPSRKRKPEPPAKAGRSLPKSARSRSR